MTRQITLYSRQGCCLCEEMKEVVRKVAGQLSLEVDELDVDADPRLREEFGHEVPVLFINGRKIFKFRVTERELHKKLKRHRS